MAMVSAVAPMLATPSLDTAAISERDPAWLAALNAPFDDTESEQELADVDEAKRTGRFVSGEEVSRVVAARRSR